MKFVGLIDNERESLHVEFKEKDLGDKLSESDKKNFSRPLSAFSNSEGGILIWGIADYESDVEPKNRLKPISNVVSFEQRLRSFYADAISAPNPGFQMSVIFKNQSKSTGYIKCYIPESDQTPHQAYDGKYYISTVEGVLYMQNFQVADMFGKRQKPLLQVKFHLNETILNQDGLDDEGYYPPVEVRINVLNKGRAIGRDVMLILIGPKEGDMKLNLNIKEAMVNPLHVDSKEAQRYQILFRANFYPTLSTNIGTCNLRIHKDCLETEIVKMSWVLFADNMQRKEGSQTFLKGSNLGKGEVGI